MHLKWLKIDIETDESDFSPPFFIGSMLRGAIGNALKRVVCINPSYKCEECFAADDCLYHQFYELKNIAHSYRLGITLQQQKLDFSFYLFEDATKSLPYVLSAIQKALEDVGVTKARKKVKIKKINIDGKMVYDGKKFLSLKDIEPKEFELDDFHQNVHLEFSMPLRIKQKNHFARESVQLHTLINNIANRYKQLKGSDVSKLGYIVKGEVKNASFTFVDMQRYSNRQKSKMNMGGIKGKMDIYGLDKQSYLYLKLGEIIGAGKQTVFGLGSYKMKVLSK